MIDITVHTKDFPHGDGRLETMNAVRRLGKGVFCVDYAYEYDIDDLLRTGAGSVGELLDYAARHLLGGHGSFGTLKTDGGGCSTFNVFTPDGAHLMGRNFDYKQAPCMIVRTHPAKGYAAVAMADANFLLYGTLCHPLTPAARLRALLSPYVCMDGMNEKGLAIAVLQIHAPSTCQQTGRVPLIATAVIRAVLDKCATVDEAIALFRSVDMRDVMGCCYHYQVCDASGTTVLIEYVRNEMRLVYPSDPGYAGWLDGYAGEKPVQFVNNFYISTDADHSGDRGCRDTDIGGNRGRILANGLLASRGVMTEGMAMSLLAAARLDYQHPRRPWRVQTLWSAVYNLNERTVTVCPNLRYGEQYRFEVK